ncbi:phosphatidylglycerophosphatase A [candidate division WOR-3 bacterium]|nr:phosphatidylglycerophosphatase A [candidate division WOR-3 bacterium]
MKKFSYTIATFFYIGRFPFGPGTLASFISLPIFYLILKKILLYIILLTVIIIVGVLSSHSVAVESKDNDPSYVVIDEVAGMGVSLLFAPQNILYIAVAFILFRILDIFKLPFIKKVEHIGNGIGIMLDDILSGAITLIIMVIVHRFGIV